MRTDQQQTIQPQNSHKTSYNIHPNKRDALMLEANPTSYLQNSRPLNSVRSSGIPPTGLILLAMLSLELGAAVAKHLFEALGPAGTVFLRAFFAAIVLTVLWRPSVRSYRRQELLTIAGFGVTIAFMNLIFYSALARIPLGMAVTLEFVGPLAVAIFGTRRWIDLLWVTLAGAGVLLLSPLLSEGAASLDPIGVGLSLLAGAFWAAYILMSERTGKTSAGGSSLALALCVASVILLPFGVASAGASLLNPVLLVIGFGVAMLSSAIPFSLEFAALKRIPAHVFGLLMSFEPAVAAIVGFILLREGLTMREVAAIVLVTLAAIGSSQEQKSHR